LHWFTVIGAAALTVDCGSTVQLTVPPPPFAEPLHWVTVALVVFAGKGAQVTVPPAPEPTHWFTVAVPTGSAPGTVGSISLVTVTSQRIGWAASLSEPLHWLICVTMLVELLVKVPLPGGHGPSAHCRVRVVVEPSLAPPILFTTTTEQVISVVAPSASGPMPLHCATALPTA